MNEGVCKSCGAKMLWVVMASGKKNPLNYEPDKERGNVFVTSDGKGITQAPDEASKARKEGFPLYLSHFVTCPGAAQFKSKK